MLSTNLLAALDAGDPSHLHGASASSDRDALQTLLTIYDLHIAPYDRVGDRAELQHHPVVAELKYRYDQWLIDTLDVRLGRRAPEPADVAESMRRIARKCNDGIYDWIATDADWHQLITFLSIEGGPDGGFDDLVALCQVGLRGEPKVVLGANYWDEMGGGDTKAVHTELHRRHVEAMHLEAVPLDRLPIEALFRTALNGLLATNRSLQPEMIGALGLLELQAGPRCRRVVRALERLDAPIDALPFYEEHANTDPRHGKEWLDNAVGPLVEENPDWGPRIVKGARWRADVNDRLFGRLHTMLATRELLSA